jgi:hypothetical protein
MEILLPFITFSGVLYYVPSIYSIILTKNATFSNIPPVLFECLYNGLLIYYAYDIDDYDLLQNNSIVFFLSFVEFVLLLSFAYVNHFRSIPSIHSSKEETVSTKENEPMELIV